MTIIQKDGSGSLSGPLDCGEDEELFIKTANDFIPATLRIDAGGAVYLCSVDGYGLFIKRVVEVSKKEPPEIAALLEGKSLAGIYLRGGFNSDWVHCLTLGLEACQGSLKDAFMLIVDGQNGDATAQFLAQVRGEEPGLQENKTVLIVDDNLMMLELMAAVLGKDAGELAVLTATDGKEGLEILYREKVDLLVLNLTMPIMNGYQVLQMMGKNERFRKIPVILSTGIRYENSDYNDTPDPFAHAGGVGAAPVLQFEGFCEARPPPAAEGREISAVGGSAGPDREPRGGRRGRGKPGELLPLSGI